MADFKNQLTPASAAIRGPIQHENESAPSQKAVEAVEKVRRAVRSLRSNFSGDAKLHNWGLGPTRPGEAGLGSKESFPRRGETLCEMSIFFGQLVLRLRRMTRSRLLTRIKAMGV